MTELSGWAYGTRTKEVAEALAGDDLRAMSKLAVAGGMLPEGTDLQMLAASFTAASAGAAYSPFDKQVLLLADKTKGESVNDSLLTHEFVHALQDQNFDLMKLLFVRPYDFDRTEALFAVIEGDAMNVQRRRETSDAAWAHRSPEDIARQEDERFGEYRKEIGGLFPPLLTETFIFRYRDGARFVETVRRKSGERGVDELFRHPPASSEQILHPEKYFANEAPREVRVDTDAFAEQGWHLTAATPLGEIGIRGLLMAGLPAAEAVRAASGWGGDRACLFERTDDERGGPAAPPLFVWKTLWDKTEDAAKFFGAYNELLRRKGAQLGQSLQSSSGTGQVIWRENGQITLVRRETDAVIVLRGTEEDVTAALQFAQR